MAKTLQFKRFSSTILANTTGASGELIIDSTKNLVTVHDGSTPGGWPVARESVINAINNAQSVNIQQSRDTANLALVQANLAFVQINADLNLQGGLNSANANIALIQGSMVTSNANIAMLIGIQTTQNTNITTTNNTAVAAFNKANNALANTSGTFGGNLNVAGTMNVNNILTVTTSPPASSPSITIISTQNQNLLLQAVSNTWTFVANGTTTFPTNITIDYSGNNVQFPRIIADSGKAFSIQGQGNTGSAALAWTVDPNAASQYAQIGVTKGGDNLAKVILTAQSDSGDAGTAKTWTFNQIGSFTFPDLSVQNTAFTGTAIDQTARNTANSAAANSAGVVIDTFARTTANTATNNVVILQGTNTSQNTRMSVIEGNLTSAYAKANTNISSDLTLTVTNSGVGAYLIDGSSNPTVTLYRGVTYYFSINAVGHPLYIQTVSGAYSSGNVYTSGVTGGGTQVGTLTFTVPLDAPSNLYYVCQNHSAMNGAFVISNLISTINTQSTNIAAAAQTVPQNAQSTNYTLQLTDAGKHIYYTQSSNTILYIPTTSNVAFANGSTIMIVSRTSSNANITVTPNTGVSLYLAGITTSASRNVTTYGMATLIQVAANTWFINGSGVL